MLRKKKTDDEITDVQKGTDTEKEYGERDLPES
jgi:hypothetical protein